MKKLLSLIFTLSVFVFSSCENADDINSFPYEDYSELIQQNSYVISPSTKALTVLNLFYDKFGYGEHSINGTAIHKESANLIDTSYEESISCDVKKVNIYHIDNSTKGMSVSAFYVDFYNTDDEVLSYCYEWQYKNTNVWKNEKTSTFFQTSNWYKKSDSKTKTSWNITITQ